MNIIVASSIFKKQYLLDFEKASKISLKKVSKQYLSKVFNLIVFLDDSQELKWSWFTLIDSLNNKTLLILLLSNFISYLEDILDLIQTKIKISFLRRIVSKLDLSKANFDLI